MTWAHDGVHPEAPPETSNISSLLYEWHNKRKKSEHSPWGLVAPIVLDTGSASQRAHAFETVHAYCAAHALHLVSLIVSPPCAPLYPWELAPPRNPQTSRKHDAGKPSDNTRASIALWGTL
ncbi:hypothetical protein A0H81_04125 [Grifola frondosa]|uniref:Uncharacterized protein n=1 Tax=Grifola frondosa TaxID=5627 RepID=A0A1C7MES4_GRIFR|nr:hypothetical protein A0H81_04125 [Grifola frondosa]